MASVGFLSFRTRAYARLQLERNPGVRLRTRAYARLQSASSSDSAVGLWVAPVRPVSHGSLLASGFLRIP